GPPRRLGRAAGADRPDRAAAGVPDPSGGERPGRTGVGPVAAGARPGAAAAAGADAGDGAGVADAVRPPGRARDLRLPRPAARLGRGAALRLAAAAAAGAGVARAGAQPRLGGAAALVRGRPGVAVAGAAAGHGAVRGLAVRLRRDPPHCGLRIADCGFKDRRNGACFGATGRLQFLWIGPRIRNPQTAIRYRYRAEGDMSQAGATYESSLLLTPEAISQPVSRSPD